MNNTFLPTQIEYFINKNIKLEQICCGAYHSLVLSNVNEVYVFGQNHKYQCGNNNNKNVLIPALNETLKDEIISTIKCGWSHNMVKNGKNEYYLWGDNYYNQCIVKSMFNVNKPSLFESKHFINKNQQIID
eukprot:516105_1